MKQIIASPGTKNISDIYQRVKQQTLILQPAFQRRFVWSNSHKENFIDTVLSGYPTPEIYIAQSGIDIEKIEAVEVVVDGQQRLSTLVEYIDEPKDSKIYGNAVPKYKNLTIEQKKDFLGYLLIIRDLGDITPDQIKEVFRRINSTQYSLNAVELHNAVYDGAFITSAKNILEELKNKSIRLPFLSETQISRMDDLYYILLILSTIEEGGYFASESAIEKTIKEYNQEYPDSEKTEKQVIDTFILINSLNLNIDSLWMKKSSFFTMFIELYNVYSKISKSKTTLKKLLLDFEEKISKHKNEDKSKNRYAEFYSYIYTGTNSRKARIARSELFKAEIINKAIAKI